MWSEEKNMHTGQRQKVYIIIKYVRNNLENSGKTRFRILDYIQRRG